MNKTNTIKDNRAIIQEVMSSEHNFNEFIDFWSKQADISIKDVIAIYGQNNNITDLETYKDWQIRGRQVKLGHSGFKIKRNNINEILFDISATFKQFDVESLKYEKINTQNIELYYKDTLKNTNQQSLFKHDLLSTSELDLVENLAMELIYRRFGSVGDSRHHINYNDFKDIELNKLSIMLVGVSKTSNALIDIKKSVKNLDNTKNIATPISIDEYIENTNVSKKEEITVSSDNVKVHNKTNIVDSKELEKTKSIEKVQEIEKTHIIEEPPIVEESQVLEDIQTFQNYKIPSNINQSGTSKVKYQQNIQAIKTLQAIESENRQATTEEQEILSKYAGWGGLSDVFDITKSSWTTEFTELKELLTEEEYAKAKESTLTSHYTDIKVIDAMYKGLSHLGFEQGRLLEPSLGIGNFFGRLPDNMQNSELYGVELDTITGRISKLLYPNANIQIKGYENTNFKNNYFDVALSNVPFGNFGVYDKDYKTNFLIHDYFFQKSLDKVRAGGVVAFITSSGTLDKDDETVRRYMAERADLVGAIRLPNNAFKDNANTSVTTDIIFLQKKSELEIGAEPNWIHTSENSNGIKINNYYIENENMMLGVMERVSSRFGFSNTLQPMQDKPLEDMLNTAIQQLPKEIYKPIEHTKMQDTSLSSTKNNTEDKNYKNIPLDESIKENGFKVVNDIIYQRSYGEMKVYDIQTGLKSERIKGLCTLKPYLHAVFDAQTNNLDDTSLSIAQSELSTAYDKFVNKYGYINNSANIRVFKEDPESYLLMTLEQKVNNTESEKNAIYEKSDIFTKRVISATAEIANVNTPQDSLIVSMTQKGYIDLDYMSEISKLDKEFIIESLENEIYKNPLTKKYEPTSQYLSGNVREKLKIATYSNNNNEYDKNIKALTNVLPKTIKASDINVRLGATWVDSEIVSQFINELLDVPPERGVEVDYYNKLSEWKIHSYAFLGHKNSVTYGTNRMKAIDIIASTLNMRTIRIVDKIDDDTYVYNVKETEIAKSKQAEIISKFEEWIFKDVDRLEYLEEKYNNTFNSTVLRQYDGKYLTFNGMNPNIKLKEHQTDAIARILYSGENTLLAHQVGAGKTFECIAGVMEQKRLGLVKKPMIVVPNYLTEQWGSEFLRLYPQANILVVTKKDFTPEKRKQFTAKIATGDWDAVIMGHSQLTKIPVSEERMNSYRETELTNLENTIQMLKSKQSNGTNDKDRISIKQLENRKKTLSTKLNRLQDFKRDDVLEFEKLGVDCLVVDEAHEFKNLSVLTKMTNVSGISTSDSKKATDMLLKVQYINEINKNRGVIFATGTPISNSVQELYVMQKYLQPDDLLKKGIDSFDSWASVFGEVTSNYEVSPDGSHYKERIRFSKFHNLPELLTSFKNIADIKTSESLNLDVPKLKNNKFTIIKSPKSDELSMVLDDLSERSEKIKNRQVAPKDDNMLKITSEGRKSALDLRVLSPIWSDLPDSKVNKAVENIYNIWRDTEVNKSTQMVFCDLSTPKSNGDFNVYDDIKDKLIEKGIPENEVAFIHDFESDVAKSTLFENVREGNVRILMGSTGKMGTGVNVQNKLIALHHIDVPWRPSDMEQREGRIIRQGNTNKEVEIFRYVTEGSFDSYMYQILENKQRFISQIMVDNTSSISRSADDIGEQILSYEEIKSIATGNPYILEKFKIDNEVNRLSNIVNRLKIERTNMNNQLETLPNKIESLKLKISKTEKDIALRDSNESENFEMTIQNNIYNKRSDAGEELYKQRINFNRETKVIGELNGFELLGGDDSDDYRNSLALRANNTYKVRGSDNNIGTITILENTLNKLEKVLATQQYELYNAENKLKNIKEELKQPIKHVDKLNQLKVEQTRINKQLGVKQEQKLDSKGYAR